MAEYLVLQNEPDSVQQEADFDIRLAAGATLDLVFLSLHGGGLRNRIRVSLDGEKAVCNLGGLSVADGEERMDYDIVLTHQVPGCRSNQLFKTILSDRSQARFDGLIKVVPDAQQTEAYQANHNLLCSEEAKAETKPQLEIYADDVKCSHGATVGRLNPDELFYLRSRGIPYEEAQLLQQLAFVDEVLAMDDAGYVAEQGRDGGILQQCVADGDSRAADRDAQVLQSVVQAVLPAPVI